MQKRYQSNKPQLRSRRPGKKIVILLIVLLIVAIGGAFLYQTKKDKPATTDQDYINYNPPTEEEQQASNAVKENTAEDNDAERTENQSVNTNNSSKKSANVIITYAEQTGSVVEVNSFVSNVLQDGTCTITFQKGNQRISKSTPAYADASSTICTNPQIKTSEFPSSGKWTLRVAYESSTAKGSQTEEVNINK